MFDYKICNVFDADLFIKQCAAIEKHIPHLRKKDFLEDVDGSQSQTYIFPDGKVIKVTNDRLFGIDIDSERNLDEYFN